MGVLKKWISVKRNLSNSGFHSSWIKCFSSIFLASFWNIQFIVQSLACCCWYKVGKKKKRKKAYIKQIFTSETPKLRFWVLPIRFVTTLGKYAIIIIVLPRCILVGDDVFIFGHDLDWISMVGDISSLLTQHIYMYIQEIYMRIYIFILFLLSWDTTVTHTQ